MLTAPSDADALPRGDAGTWAGPYMSWPLAKWHP